MKKIILLALTIMLCSAVSSFASDNFLTNAGFEDPISNPPWEEKREVTGTAQIDRVIGGMDSDYSAKLWASDNNPSTILNLRQYFSVTPGDTYYGSAYLKSISSEPVTDLYKAWVEIVWTDALHQGGLPGNALSPYLKAPNNDWQFFQASGVAPEGAVYAWLSLKLEAPVNSGTMHAVYFDNAWAGTTAAPEPISSALFLIGGATLAIRRYAKKR